uniref:Uncharacterized protein n=1 Tax=Nelumbo nucifera TaxID=4432 RepID=A0A822ZQY9_NELNU|nr:TPA_asm: hypothetical protein HUJ06_017244 [Nelumbo nucifera]
MKSQLDDGVSFLNEDMKGMQVSHDGTIVVSLIVANFTICRILVDDTMSLVDIILFKAFKQIEINTKCLQPVNTSIARFSRNTVRPDGKNTLPVTFGESPN